ncbi:KTSC domain-containing protein [Polynucleobacter sp. UK-Kesae-W10]|uniref:KTSC domain-containing protein n=1 Tax=Polynucleobacter sp. UK-Kesae-W10 TaxID=1819738 RepID=UPI001C0E0CAD|nr:KTSC domain-containing protein [Polynucleobacter sp. UK-Kesae-W10]MBU3577489.1 KTSC domain-containing protein [Polynucleobacter sp. UK-Kesae-W10]
MTKRDLPITQVKSSNVHGYHYDPTVRVLTIQFKTGKSYKYADVSPDSMGKLLAADSFGSHLSKHIIKKHKVIT